MKKRLFSLIFLAISLVLIFFICSCQDDKNEGTKVVFIDRDEKYGYHEHSWETVSQTLPTCTDEGETVMQCKRCHKINKVSVPTVECEYEVSWDMYNGNTVASVVFSCKRNSAHNYTTNAIIQDKDIVMASCQTPGKEIYDLAAYYKGKEYKTEYVVTKKYGGHRYVTVTESLGDFCYDGVKTVEKCKACGYVRSSSTRYDHLSKQEVARYDLSKLGYCDGTVIYKACACGCQTELTFENLTCKTTEKIDEYTVNGKNVYSRSIKSCSNCALKIVTESAYYGENITPSGANIVFRRTSVSLSDEISLETSITYNNHKTTNHTFSYEFESLGEKCTDGVIVTKTCNECIYTIKYLTKGHTPLAETTHFGEGECGFDVTVMRCHCGYVDDIKIENKTCDFIEINASEHFGYDVSYTESAYKCETCGTSHFIGSVLIKVSVINGFVDYKHVKLCSVKINGETALEIESDTSVHSDWFIPGLDDFAENPDRFFEEHSLTDEERQAIEDYFQSLKNQS